MEYENEKSGVKIIDKRKTVEEAPPSFGKLFLKVLKDVFIVGFATVGVLLGLWFVSLLIEQGVNAIDFGVVSWVITWFWTLNAYVQLTIITTVVLIAVSFIITMVMYFGDDS